jgi:hypothetical protein
MNAVSTYAGAHKRVKRVRGKADDYVCFHCQAQARHRAYDDCDSKVQRGPVPSGLILDFSSNPWHYIPLCVSCHFKFDGRTLGGGYPIEAARSGGKKSTRISPRLEALKSMDHLGCTEAARLLGIGPEQVRRLRLKIKNAESEAEIRAKIDAEDHARRRAVWNVDYGPLEDIPLNEPEDEVEEVEPQRMTFADLDLLSAMAPSKTFPRILPTCPRTCPARLCKILRATHSLCGYLKVIPALCVPPSAVSDQ